MNKQKGAALVIVLALLSGSLMIGVSGMNSALIDERLAGNYRASAIAQMTAEQGASQLTQSDLDAASGSCQDLVGDYASVEDWENIAISELSNSGLARFVTCTNSGGADVLLIQGRIEGTSAVSFITRSFGGGSGVPSFVTEVDIDDFFQWLVENLDELNAEENCNENEYVSGGIYYCGSGDFTSDIDSSLNGVTLISAGDISSNVKGDVENLTLITPGEVTFRGVGQDGVTGFVWSGGDVTINGGGGQEFDISVCASEEATVNGGSLADNQFCGWIESFVTDNLGYEGGSGSSGTGWTQL